MKEETLEEFKKRRESIIKEKGDVKKMDYETYKGVSNKIYEGMSCYKKKNILSELSGGKIKGEDICKESKDYGICRPVDSTVCPVAGKIEILSPE